MVVAKCLRLLNLKWVCPSMKGVNGYLPAVYTRRTAESDAWTLHRAFSLGNLNNTDNKSESDSTDAEMASNYPHEDAAKLGHEKSEETYKEWANFWESVRDHKHKDVLTGHNDIKSTAADGHEENIVANSNGNSKQNRRWVFAMRHGERVDLTYGQWVPFCFDGDKYIRKDLNMPLTLGERVGGKESYALDSPLTRVGRLQAQLVGEGLRLANVPIKYVYASAALRCVETAHEFLKGLQADPSVKIRVDPGLFEFKTWYVVKGLAPFMTPIELHKAGYNVDLNYEPYVEVDSDTNETLDEYYDRNEKVFHSAIKDTEAEGGNIIFVGHAATLDQMVFAIKRLTQSRSEHVPYQLSKNLLRVPYCALGAVKDKPWQVVSPPCPPSINSSSGRFDWRLLED